MILASTLKIEVMRKIDHRLSILYAQTQCLNFKLTVLVYLLVGVLPTYASADQAWVAGEHLGQQLCSVPCSTWCWDFLDGPLVFSLYLDFLD